MVWYYMYLDIKSSYISHTCLKLNRFICYTILHNKSCGIQKLQRVEKRLPSDKLVDSNTTASDLFLFIRYFSLDFKKVVFMIYINLL